MARIAVLGRGLRDGRGSPVPETEQAPEAPPHAVSLVDRGPFVQPVCSCGWGGAGRRSRPAARAEAERHAGSQT